MYNEMISILHSAGVGQHYRGYSYFIKAVEMAAENPDRLQNIRRDIYQPIATSFQTTFSNVEKNLRTVRDVFIKNGGDKLLSEIIGSPFWLHNKPYPRELIELFAIYLTDKIRLN